MFSVLGAEHDRNDPAIVHRQHSSLAVPSWMAIALFGDVCTDARRRVAGPGGAVASLDAAQNGVVLLSSSSLHSIREGGKELVLDERLLKRLARVFSTWFTASYTSAVSSINA